VFTARIEERPSIVRAEIKKLLSLIQFHKREKRFVDFRADSTTNFLNVDLGSLDFTNSTPECAVFVELKLCDWLSDSTNDRNPQTIKNGLKATSGRQVRKW
jgi:hypothetical protein